MVGYKVLEVLYGENVFRVHLHEGGGEELKGHSSDVNIRRIGRTQVVMKPESVTYRRMLMIDTTLWSPVFAQLTKLSIVAQQPLGARIHLNEYPIQARNARVDGMAQGYPAIHFPSAADVLCHRDGR